MLKFTLGNCGSERAVPSYALYIHFSSASINCNKRPHRCKSHHQSPLSVGRFISFDDADINGGFDDEDISGGFVCSDEDPSTFFVVLSIGQAKNRKVSKH
jgi:hypothetical protein